MLVDIGVQEEGFPQVEIYTFILCNDFFFVWIKVPVNYRYPLDLLRYPQVLLYLLFH